jgi:hypothetical protein
MKKVLIALRPWAEGCFIAIMAMAMIDWVTNPTYNQPYVYPTSEKLEAQGFKKLPGESAQEHEKRAASVIDYARSFPG